MGKQGSVILSRPSFPPLRRNPMPRQPHRRRPEYPKPLAHSHDRIAPQIPPIHRGDDSQEASP